MQLKLKGLWSTLTPEQKQSVLSSKYLGDTFGCLDDEQPNEDTIEALKSSQNGHVIRAITLDELLKID